MKESYSPVNTQIFGRDLLDRMKEGFTDLGFKHGVFSTTKKDTYAHFLYSDLKTST